MAHEALALLVQAYLNQDWPFDYPDVWAAVDDFIEKEPPTQELLDDIDDVLERTPSEDDVRRYLLEDLESNYIPDPDGYSMTDWLTALRNYVQKRLSLRPRGRAGRR